MHTVHGSSCTPGAPGGQKGELHLRCHVHCWLKHAAYKLQPDVDSGPGKQTLAGIVGNQGWRRLPSVYVAWSVYLSK